MILRFGVFFDGTGNNQHNVMPTESNGGKGASYTNALSNVALLHALYPAEGRAATVQWRFSAVMSRGGHPGGR